MTSLDRLRGRFDEWRDDPDYLYEGVVLELTEQIAAQMKERGISRSDLAERLGTSRAYVTKLLDGQENMTVKTLVRVANALEMKVGMKLVPRERASRPVKSGRSAVATKNRAPSRRSPAKRVAVAARTKR